VFDIDYENGGKDGIVIINKETTKIIIEYLRIRPALLIGGQRPLFDTDYRRRWKREEVYRILMNTKKWGSEISRGFPCLFQTCSCYHNCKKMVVLI
jgi:site-specific recombinase XerD